MIVGKPARLLSLAIVALVVLVGVRGIVGSIASRSDLLQSAGADSVATGQRTSGVVAYVVDGDTVDRQLVVDRTRRV